MPGVKHPFNRASVLLEGMGSQLGLMGHLSVRMYSVNSVGLLVWCRPEGWGGRVGAHGGNVTNERGPRIMRRLRQIHPNQVCPFIIYNLSNELDKPGGRIFIFIYFWVSLGRRLYGFVNRARCSFRHSLDTPAGPEMTLIRTERCPMRPREDPAPSESKLTRLKGCLYPLAGRPHGCRPS